MKKRIKILHFVSGLGNDGVTQVIENYTSKLNQHYNIENIVVYQHHASDDKILELEKIGDRLYEIPYKSERPFANLYATYKIIRKEHPDIVHAHMSLLSFYPLSIAWLMGVKVRIAHAHIAQDNINSKLAKIFKRLNCLFANHYMACGHEAGKYLFGDRKFDVMYNAIDQDKFEFNLSNRNSIRKQFGIKDGTILLGNIGRLTKQKNQLFLIDIFKDFQEKHKNTFLIIIGKGELKDKLKFKIDRFGLQDKIKILDGTNNPQYYYSAFDFFLLPSLYEGLPVSAIEAQASGVRTILSTSIDESVNYNNASFISIHNGTKPWIDEMEKKMEKNKRFCEPENIYNINVQYKNLYRYYRNYLMDSGVK